MTKNFRFEKDSMGQIKVPSEALWGAQTQRSIINFSIGEELIPIESVSYTHLTLPTIYSV